jgi:hypothetical protein
MRQKQKADAGDTCIGLDFLDGHRDSSLYRGNRIEGEISLVKYSDLKEKLVSL